MTNKKQAKALSERLGVSLMAKIRYILSNKTTTKALSNKLSLHVKVQDYIEAYTDGSKIVAKGPYKTITGLCFHELGHLLYTWFRSRRVMNQALQEGFVRGLPSELFDEENFKVKVVTEKLKSDRNLQKFFVYSWAEFDNIVEDGYLERTLLMMYKGVFAKGLRYLRQYTWETDLPTIQEVQNKIDEESITELRGIYGLMLEYLKYGRLKRENDAELTLPIMDKFRVLGPKALGLLKEHRKVVRAQKTASFFIEELWDLLLDEYQSIKEWYEQRMSSDDSEDIAGKPLSSGSEGIEGGSSIGTEASPFEDRDVDSEKMEELDNPDEDSSSDGNDGADSENNKDDEGSAEENSEEEGFFEPGEEGLRPENPTGHNRTLNEDDEPEVEANHDEFMDFLERLEEEAEKSATVSSEASSESEADTDKLSIEATMKANCHHGIDSKVVEQNEAVEEYNKIAQKTEPVAEQIANEIEDIMLQFGGDYTKRGLYYGQHLDLSQIYRPDCGMFNSTITGQEEKSLAFFLLIDESGSMRGQRVHYTKHAAIVLESVARRLNLPCAVYGHTEHSAVSLLKYRDFDDGEEMKYRLPNIAARFNNRDGFALRFACEKLSQREEDKVLFIISDGSPAASRDYCGSVANQDIQDVISDFPDITIVAAAIGDDREKIRSIYGPERFLDCSDLQTMGPKLAKILQKSVLGW